MSLLRRLAFLTALATVLQLSAQDQIIYLNGDKNYVDKIDTVYNDSLSYTSFKKHLKVPLSEVKAYYLTIKTKENLKKSYYKRKREYFQVDSAYHIDYYNSDPKNITAYDTYLSSAFPVSFVDLEFSEGYYTTHKGDTVYTLISVFADRKKNFSLFISKDDSANFEIISASLVNSYFVEDIHYESVYKQDIDGIERCMFIYKKITGNLNLFYKPSVPYSTLRGYLIGKQASSQLIPVSLSSANNYTLSTENYTIKVANDSYGSAGAGAAASISGNLSSGNFKNWMPIVLQDCPEVASRVKAEFYTIGDIELIVNEYNKCVQ